MSESLLYITTICYIKSKLVHDFKLRIFPAAPADKQKTNIYLPAAIQHPDSVGDTMYSLH